MKEEVLVLFGIRLADSEKMWKKLLWRDVQIRLNDGKLVFVECFY